MEDENNLMFLILLKVMQGLAVLAEKKVNIKTHANEIFNDFFRNVLSCADL